MTYSYKIIICCSLFLGVITTLNAQQAKEPNTLNFVQFMENVKNNNIGYLVEKYNINIASANTEAARVFPDPELSFGVTDNQERKMKMGYSFEAGIDYSFSLKSRRKARMRLAKSEEALTNAILADYFRNLQADAALGYLLALKQREIVEVQLHSYIDLQRLAEADSIRLHLGAIMEVDARQSKLAAAVRYNDFIQSEADLENSLVQLSFIQGGRALFPPDSVLGELSYFKRHFDLPTLVVTAQNNRSDLQAALQSKEVSQHNLQLAKAERATDLNVSLGVGRNTEVRNELAPTPAFTSVSAGISIPLKFSTINKGELRAAQLLVEQSEAMYNETELRIESEVVQAYHNYTVTCRQVERFNMGLLSEAKTIFKSKSYSYERGNISLFEVLNAQQNYNEIEQSYYETLYNCAAALVELERVCGIWDIEIN